MFYSTYVSLNKYFEQIIIIFFTLEIYKSILSTALSTVYYIRTHYSSTQHFNDLFIGIFYPNGYLPYIIH